MATYVRPYNDWREQLAVGVITPIINGIINRSIESAQNRKQNALYAKTLQDLEAAQSQQGGITAPVAQQESLLAGAPAPEGYNSDGWAQAFHKQYTPLTQFDMGTANAAPQNTVPVPTVTGDAWQQALSKAYNPLAEFDKNTANIAPSDYLPPMNAMQSKPLTQDQILRAIYANLGDKRFSHLNPNNVMAMFNPYLQAAEQSRQEGLRKELADNYMNAQDWDSRLNLMTGGAIQGIVPESMRNSTWEQYKYDNPHMQTQSYNDGANNHILKVNPRTGEVTETMQIQNQLSPQDIANNDYRNASLRATIENNNANRALDYYKTDKEYDYRGQVHNDNYSLENRKQDFIEENTIYEREHPELGKLEDVDGNIYFYNKRTGEITKATGKDGEPIVSPNEAKNLYIRQDADGNYLVIDPKRRTFSRIVGKDGSTAKGVPPKSGTTTNPNKNLTAKEELEFNSLRDEAKLLIKQEEELQRKVDAYAEDPNDPMCKSAKEGLARVQARLDEIRKRQQEILKGTPTNTNPTPMPSLESKNSSSDVKLNNPNSSNEYEDNSPVMWVSKDGKKTITQNQYYLNKYLIETGQHSQFKTVEEFDAALPKYYNRVNSTPNNQPTSPDVQPDTITFRKIPPEEFPGTKEYEARTAKPASSGVAQQKTAITSDDKRALPPMSSLDNAPQISSADVANQNAKNVERLDLNDLPKEMFYDPERDKDVPEDNILTLKQLAKIIGKMIDQVPNKDRYLTPMVIAYQLFKHEGVRIKRA